MTLGAIILATIVAGIGSVWIADMLMRLGVNSRTGVGPQHLLSLAAGALLATAFMHLLPEAFESHVEAHHLFAVLLAGLVFFFLLDKAELWHHGHEHHHPSVAAAPHAPSLPLAGGHPEADHHHDHAHHGHTSRSGGAWAVLTGDSVHCFGDGILIASAFMADMRLGFMAAVAVLAHEVPHHMGDLAVLRQNSSDRQAALLKVSLAGSVTALGGVVGYFLVAQLHDWLPFFLVVASSSFIYVALADLIPQLQRRLSARQTAAQVAWLLVGIAAVTLLSGLAHSSH